MHVERHALSGSARLFLLTFCVVWQEKDLSDSSPFRGYRRAFGHRTNKAT